MGNNLCRKPDDSDRKPATVQSKNSSANLISSKTISEDAALSDFKKIKLLGQGGFGKVFLVEKKSKRTKKCFAMKVLQKEFILENDQFEHVMAERQILADVKSPFVVDMQYAFQTEDKLFLIMEFVGGGELITYIRQQQ